MTRLTMLVVVVGMLVTGSSGAETAWEMTPLPAAMASRNLKLSSLGVMPPTPITPMMNGMPGVSRSLRTSRMKSAIHWLYFANRFCSLSFGSVG